MFAEGPRSVNERQGKDISIMADSASAISEADHLALSTDSDSESLDFIVQSHHRDLECSIICCIIHKYV